MLPLRSVSVAFLIALSSCAGAPPGADSPPARKVLIIGVDGMRGDALTRAPTPHLDRLVRAGHFTDDARNAWTAENAWNGHSATNWGVLLTGVSPTRTGLTANGDAEHLVHDDREGAFRTLFGHLRAHDPRLETAVFHTWPGIAVGDGAPLGSSSSVIDHTLCPASGPTSAERDVTTTGAVVACLSGSAPYDGADPDVMFVHLSQLDSAGHEFAYGSSEYAASVARVDGLVGRMIAAIEGRPGRARERWLVILSADHGGPEDSTGHADNSLREVHTIPFLVWGDGIGTGRLNGPSLYDVTPTALEWMGVQPGLLELEGASLLRQ